MNHEFIVMFYSLILSLLLIPSIVATDFPSYDLPCEPVTCGDQLNVTSCVATCCCVWCNSTLQSRQKSNLKGQAVSIGYCIQASYACQADTIMVECARDPTISHFYYRSHIRHWGYPSRMACLGRVYNDYKHDVMLQPRIHSDASYIGSYP